MAAQRVRQGKIAAVWLDPRYVHIAIADATSAQVERHAAVPAPAGGRLETACLELAQFAVGGAPLRSVLALSPALEDVPAPRPPAPSEGMRPLAIAKWGALAATAGLGIVGLGESNAKREGLLGGAAIAAAAALVLFVIDARRTRGEDGGPDSPDSKVPGAKPPDVESLESPKPPNLSLEMRPGGLAIRF